MVSDDNQLLQESIAWNAHRATAQAIEKCPVGIPDGDSIHIEVTIHLRTTSWPGETDTGRSKNSIIGSAACTYVPRKETP